MRTETFGSELAASGSATASTARAPGVHDAPPGGSYDELNEAAGHPTVVELRSPARLTMQAHTSSPLTLTLKNNRSQTRSYGLVVTASSGIDLSGLPATVTLAPGESKTLMPTLTAGDASEAAFFELNAEHTGGDATDASSLVTEARIINQAVPDQPGLSQPGNPGNPPVAPGQPNPGPGPNPGSGPSDRTAPTQTLSGSRRQDIDKLFLRVQSSEPATILATATVKIKRSGKVKTYRFRDVVKGIQADTRVKLRLKLKSKYLRVVKRALRRGQRVSVKIKVIARDGAGNMSSAKRTVKLKD